MAETINIKKNKEGFLADARENKSFMVLTILVFVIFAIAILGDTITPYDPLETHMTNAFQAPNSAHIMGTDRLGRDVCSRVIAAARISVPSALVLVAVILVVGTFLGIVAGYFGGVVDAIIMRIADMMIAFPGMVLAIAVAGFMGASMGNAIIALAIVSWTKYARLARSLTLKIVHEDYVEAAKVTGASAPHILIHYMLPNVMPTMIITAATDVGGMMLEIAGLSFLGFGAQPPNPEWGLMLSEGRQYFTSRPWLIVYPGIALAIVVSVFNLWGDALRDVLDPRSH